MKSSVRVLLFQYSSLLFSSLIEFGNNICYQLLKKNVLSCIIYYHFESSYTTNSSYGRSISNEVCKIVEFSFFLAAPQVRKLVYQFSSFLLSSLIEFGNNVYYQLLNKIVISCVACSK